MSMRVITHIVLHYSATYADQDITRDDIDKMHRARGWKMIGYHWFIRRDGTIEQGRPKMMVGAHVGGQNSGKIGICCAGGLDRATGPNVGIDNRTEAQKQAQVALIRDVLRRHPGAKVVGHRDLAATQCPGFDAARWWASVQHKLRPEPSPVPGDAPTVTRGVDEDRTHIVVAGDSWWSIAQEHGLTVPELLALNDAAADDILDIGDEIHVAPDRDPRTGRSASGGQGGFLASLIKALLALFRR